MLCARRHRGTCAWAAAVTICITAADARTAYADEPQPAAAPPAEQLLFEHDVRPIFTAHCGKCHGLEARKAGLDLRSAAFILKGGDSGPAIVKDSTQTSLLYERIADRSMPPEGELPLAAEHIDLVRRWLEGGAHASETDDSSNLTQAPQVTDEDRAFWAFQKPARGAVPAVRGAERVNTPIDAFLLSRLEAAELTFSPEADRYTLARRLHLDLIGLPPTPQEVQAFVEDASPDAYELLVDRLLESPHFGERWGRHWLDTAGYADTIGDDTDAGITKLAAGKWRYRDYVIAAFNADKPYDRFLVEQFAGDELFDWRSADTYTPQQRNLLIATTFLRMAPDETLQNELNTADIRHAVLQHTMETALSGVLALTIQCAKCHSHKFDPLPQEDYYRLLAVFTPAFNPQSWLQPGAREMPDVAPAEKKHIEEHNTALDTKIAGCRARIDAIRKPYVERLRSERLAQIPENIRGELQAALATGTDQRSEKQKALIAEHGEKVKVPDADAVAALGESDRVEDEKLAREVAERQSQRRSWETIQAVYDVGDPPPTYILRRGNHEAPGQEVAPGALRVLSQSDALSTFSPESPYGHASGRRLALARWLTDGSSPAGGLVARVYVNRVWQQLFGLGIVASSDNFGASGSEPTHLELLDWLAVEFMENGWRTKPLIKLLVMSTSYRQTSRESGGALVRRAEEADPDNTLLWRMRLRPLEAEIVRDSVLAVSGTLDTARGGPPIMHAPEPNGLVNVVKDGLPTPTSANRRSVYLLCRRRYQLSMLDTFNQPEVAGACLRRNHAPVVGQSLTMLNDPFVLEQSRAFAKRVKGEMPDAAPQDRIDRAFRLALGRPALESEIRWSEELLAQHAIRYRNAASSDQQAGEPAFVHLCQMLLGTSEFLYIP